jgi:hypothetical protein
MSRLNVMLTLAVVLFVGAMASAQSTRQAAPTEAAAVAALTVEVRALRAELAETARTSLWLQLLTARIQAQEQRIIYLDRRRSEASMRRGNAEQSRNEVASQVQTFSNPERSRWSEQQLRDFEGMLGDAKRRLSDQDRVLQQAQVEENDAINALRQEQDRWGDINARLEELDRTLGAR